MNSTKRVKMRWVRVWKTCLLGMAAVPLALSLSLSVGEISEAYGCGGTGYVGTGLLRATFVETDGRGEDELAEPIRIDKSGFFVVQLGVRGDVQAATSTVSVQVTNAGGQPVSGALTQLHVRDAYDGLQEVTLGWTASAELELGNYEATLTSPIQALNSTAQLRVVDASAELQTLPLSGATLKRIIYATGFPVTCRAMPNPAGCWTKPTLEVGGETGTLTELAADYAAPELPVAIAWELKLREVPGKGTLEPSTPQLVFQRYDGRWWTDAYFRDTVAEYCVDVEARDLRTQNTAFTRACAAADSNTPIENRDAVSRCAEPTPELKDRWCALPQNSNSSFCVSTNPGTDPPAPGATPPVGSGDGEANSGREGGCSVALAESRGPAPLTLLGGIAALAALSLRRRWQRRSDRR